MATPGATTGGPMTPDGRGGGRRTTGRPESAVSTVCLVRTDIAGEGYPSWDGARPTDDLRLMATLDEYAVFA